MLRRRRPVAALAALAAVVAAVGCGAGGGGSAFGAPRSTTTTTTGPLRRVRVTSGVEYGTGRVGAPAPGETPLLLDLYQPAGPPGGRRPVVIAIHGGGFTGQSRTDEGIVRIARALAAQGIVVASIDYRLMGHKPVPSARVAALVPTLPRGDLFSAMVAAVDDTLTATDYLAAHAADLDLDMGRLGLVGSSAGAMTADTVGYALDDHGIHRPPVRFVASLWGGIYVAAPRALGPVAADQLGRGEPALFAVHGDADPRVPVQLDDQLAARAEAEGVRSEYHRIPGGRHGYAESGFFTRTVAGRQTSFDRLVAFALASLTAT